MCLKSEILASYRIGNVGMEMFVYSQMFGFFFFLLDKADINKNMQREKCCTSAEHLFLVK